MEQRLKSHYESLARAIEFTKMADAKAGPLLAAHVLMAGALATRSGALWAIATGDAGDIQQAAVIVLAALYLILLAAAWIKAACVFIPSTPKTGRSLIYFEDIGAMSLEQFAEASRQLNAEAIENQLLQQIHAVSGIASVKMRRVRWAFWLSIAAVVLWIVLMAWGSIAVESNSGVEFGYYLVGAG